MMKRMRIGDGEQDAFEDDILANRIGKQKIILQIG